MKKQITFLFFALLLIVVSCDPEDDNNDPTDTSSNQYYTDAADCAGNTPEYSVDIAPIFSNNCAFSGCHDAATASNGIVFESYNDAIAAFDGNKVLCAVNHGNDCEHMPRDADKLSDADILALTCWAKNDFPE